MPTGSAKIISREEPLSKIRVQSVFADGTPNLPVMENADEHWSVFDKEREVSYLWAWLREWRTVGGTDVYLQSVSLRTILAGHCKGCLSGAVCLF